MFGFITNSKFLKKYKLKNEMSLIKKKLEFLTEEALSGKSSKADTIYWDTLLERLSEINDENIVHCSDVYYDYYVDIYNKYIKAKIDK